MPVIQLTHIASVFRSMGGVEFVLRHHHLKDADQGIDSRFIVFHEDEDRPIDRVCFLGLGAQSTIRQSREKFARAITRAATGVAIYHGMWGMPYLADLDAYSRRLLMLHGDVPDMERLLRSRGGWLDGVLCVNEPLRQFVRRCLPELAAERINVVPYPVLPPFAASAKAPLAGRPLTLGYCGRLVVEQKRVDRLPVLCVQLDRAGVDFRFEFLGEGPERGWLEGQFPDRSRFLFHGRKSGEDYWRVLDRWDAMVFVSDYEGTPIAMLEGLSMGVIPLYPRIGSGGDAYAKAIQTDLLYEPEDFAQVAKVLQRLSALQPEEVEALRTSCRQSVAPHLHDNYIRHFSDFVHQMSERPALPKAAFPKRPWLLDDVSQVWLARIAPVRRVFLRLLRR